MRLDSVRALKRQALDSLILPAIAGAHEARAFAAPAGSLRRSRGPSRAVALGASRGVNARDYKLAVRVQGRVMQADAELHARLRDLAKGEVDVRYIGRVSKQDTAWNASRQRPLLIGVSAGHFAVTAGTIGAFPTHRKTGKRVLLSNNHVLANEGRATIGDAILQPGAADGGVKGTDAIGALLDFAPLKSSGSNLIDAAIASLDDSVQADHLTLTGAGILTRLRPDPLDADDPVSKLGRTTGLTQGKVTAIEVDDVVVDYEMGSLRFDRLTEIEGSGASAFSLGGDSGSLVFDAGGQAAGLLFSGTDQGGSNGMGLTYVNDLTLVLTALDLTLDI